MKSSSIGILASLCLGLPAFAGDLPEADLGALYQRAKGQPADRAERVKFNAQILADGRKSIADHPDSTPESANRELLVRRVMLPAADRLYRDDPSAENREQLMKLAAEVADAPIYEGHRLVQEKVGAAETLARLGIWPDKGGAPVEAAKRIRALVDRFPIVADRKGSAEFHGQALVCAARLALSAKEKPLADEYCKEIAKSYVSTSGALDVLSMAGQPALFEGEMTTLDGKTIKFPEDTKGKVVVLDFWATWCGPCIASLPHIREIHGKYKDRGDVLVIGVSCDSPMQKETPEQNKQKVADFVKAKDLSWTQVYSGEWPKSAVKYGIGSIPTVFVLGKDGRIVSTTARGREAQIIDQALAAPSHL